LRLAVGVFLVLLAVLGCKQAPGDSPASNIDEVRGKQYQRIVSLAPNMTETLFLVGADTQVVGRSFFCDFPAEVEALPVVPGGVNPDLERLVELKPDLVVTLDTLAPGLPGEFLRDNGIELYWSRVETAADVTRTLVELGELTGHKGTADKLAQQLESEVEAMRGKSSKTRVLFIHGHRPLITAGKDSWGDQLLRLAGVTNAAGQLEKKYPVLDLEQIVALEPDYVVDTSFAEDQRTLESFWAQFDALGMFKVVYLSQPSLLRPGPRVVEAAELIRSAMAGLPAGENKGSGK
jgi:iron complex transport system substrate-binding protein